MITLQLSRWKRQIFLIQRTPYNPIPIHLRISNVYFSWSMITHQLRVNNTFKGGIGGVIYSIGSSSLTKKFTGFKDCHLARGYLFRNQLTSRARQRWNSVGGGDRTFSQLLLLVVPRGSVQINTRQARACASPRCHLGCCTATSSYILLSISLGIPSNLSGPASLLPRDFICNV